MSVLKIVVVIAAITLTMANSETKKGTPDNDFDGTGPELKSDEGKLDEFKDGSSECVRMGGEWKTFRLDKEMVFDKEMENKDAKDKLDKELSKIKHETCPEASEVETILVGKNGETETVTDIDMEKLNGDFRPAKATEVKCFSDFRFKADNTKNMQSCIETFKNIMHEECPEANVHPKYIMTMEDNNGKKVEREFEKLEDSSGPAEAHFKLGASQCPGLVRRYEPKDYRGKPFMLHCNFFKPWTWGICIYNFFNNLASFFFGPPSPSTFYKTGPPMAEDKQDANLQKDKTDPPKAEQLRGSDEKKTNNK